MKPENTTAESQGGSTKKKHRKRYEAPTWEVEKAFAEGGLGCAKADGASCGAGPIQS